MNTETKTSRILGLAFLLQFVTSFVSGVFLKAAWFVEGNMGETMLKIAANPVLFRANILLDIFTPYKYKYLNLFILLITFISRD